MDRPSAAGFTVTELAAVLAIMAVGASALAPTARRLADRAAVVAARETIVRSLVRARARAMASGGATVTVATSPPTVRIEADGGVVHSSAVAPEGEVTISLVGGRDSTTFRFDRLGIGRFASGTIVARRGDARATLVVSSYGRIRRR
ncbi:MAG: prepilin-type N-terminal cleavage/methylation domain-containing protein [Gemmatimonadota bacterium]|nr:prepilin-type N-terminal cleavage/methylation domain-containing protein [Gemmatimonadota bacterium]MDH3424643.1 prepilin-type N-terminal cleavage/methylation domain-containing protein [Gemmatimonadota bacterium]